MAYSFFFSFLLIAVWCIGLLIFLDCLFALFIVLFVSIGGIFVIVA